MRVDWVAIDRTFERRVAAGGRVTIGDRKGLRGGGDEDGNNGWLWEEGVRLCVSVGLAVVESNVASFLPRPVLRSLLPLLLKL